MQPEQKCFQVKMQYNTGGKQEVLFKMPAWTPGYYQIMRYADQVQQFTATDVKGKSLLAEKKGDNGWLVRNNGADIVLQYQVKATRKFVAANYIDQAMAYLSPAGVFLHPDGEIQQQVLVEMAPFPGWNKVATGLDLVKGTTTTYLASDYDVLYDSPFLLGANLEELPSFSVKGKPHHFIAYQPGDFDRHLLMQDLQKIVTTASDMIGDIPYEHYSFLAIGPGGGGIEHLNSTSISFSGQGLNNRANRNRIYHFLTHEYFHHYNVKRIRPVELGPFDYDKGSKTKSLWVSEGLNVYYENLILKRAGLITDEEVLTTVQQQIAAYEAKPGRLFQTLAASSYETWMDGPFGRTGDEVNKTISYYDKGPVVGVLLDFRIRHATGNKKSLDDVMRRLYYEYYKKKGRGFTEEELKKEIEWVSGQKMDDFFEYIYTLKPLDYKTYLAYAGISIDLTPKKVPNFTGLTVTVRNDSLFAGNIEWQSPAWEAGIRRQQHIMEINGVKMRSLADFQQLQQQWKTGEQISIRTWVAGTMNNVLFTVGEKEERSYQLSIDPTASDLAKQIRVGWLNGRVNK
jgi:predicted metalloprotease with PDZ domain